MPCRCSQQCSRACRVIDVRRQLSLARGGRAGLDGSPRVCVYYSSASLSSVVSMFACPQLSCLCCVGFLAWLFEARQVLALFPVQPVSWHAPTHPTHHHRADRVFDCAACCTTSCRLGCLCQVFVTSWGTVCAVCLLQPSAGRLLSVLGRACQTHWYCSLVAAGAAIPTLSMAWSAAGAAFCLCTASTGGGVDTRAF